MIKKIEIITNSVDSVDFLFNNNKVTFENELKFMGPITLKFTFKDPIVSVRNHDFTWSLPYESYCASIFTPKLIKLQNNYLVQANITSGSWHIDTISKRVLYWCFNQNNQRPITQYKGESNLRNVITVPETINLKQLSLLFTKGNGIEFSRSIIPFSGIICFTDHCDFDTLVNLQTLRGFFKDFKIKTTKGFFLNQFSKRKGNVSYENALEELSLWKKDGHEMAYHSITQSLRKPEQAFKEFEEFNPVFSASTWIDHGYQPYNLSLSSYTTGSFLKRISHLKVKGVNNFWNYIDSGFATNGVINQLNPNHFTLNAYRQGIRVHSIKKRLRLIIKNIIFHYYATPEHIDNYKSLASSFKNGFKIKSIKAVLKFWKHFTFFLKEILSIIFKWKKTSEIVYPLAKYTPIIFKTEDTGFLFQTLEMTDFVNGMSISNLDVLIKESGLCILHTYFSVQLNYHEGRLLLDDKTINPHTLDNFKYLSQQLSNQQLWNPTLEELSRYLNGFFNLELDINSIGDICEVSNTYLISRKV